MSHKQFAERLNQELDDIGAPLPYEERVDVLAKLIKIHRFQADALLNGTMLPEEAILDLLATELEVSPDWLLGKTNHH